MIKLTKSKFKKSQAELLEEQQSCSGDHGAAGIVTSQVKTAVKNILVKTVIESIWRTHQFLHLGKQGTSQNESVHAYLSASKHDRIARQNYSTLKIQLSIKLYFFNERWFCFY